MQFVSGKLKLQGNIQKAMQFNTLVLQKQNAKLKETIEKLGLLKAKL